TPIPLTINVVASCTNGVVTATISSVGTAMPSGATFVYRLLDSSLTRISGTQASTTSPLPKTVTDNTQGNYGTITFEIRPTANGTVIPAGYALTNPLPLRVTANCIAPPTPTNTPVTPTNTPTKTFTPGPPTNTPTPTK